VAEANYASAVGRAATRVVSCKSTSIVRTLKVEGSELFYAYMVDNQAIVIPETIDAIRALTGLEADANASIERTNEALGIRGSLI
jgi:hypothetical protein